MTESCLKPYPLVPPEVDLRDFGFMPVDVVRVRDSRLNAEQSPAENWAAFLLWCASWHQVPAGSIPDSDVWQATQAGYARRGKIDPEWHEIRDGARRGYVTCSDGRLYHPVVCEKALEAWQSKVARHARTAAATAARLAKKQADEDAETKGRRGSRSSRSTSDQPSRARNVHQGTGTGTGTGTGILSISPTSVGESTSGDPRPDPGLLGDAPPAPKPRKRAGTAGAPASPAPAAVQRPSDVSEEVWAAWLDLRRKKRAPVSSIVLQGAVKEAAAAQLSLEDFLRVWCYRGTQGLLAEWIKPQDRQLVARAAQDRVGSQLRTASLMVNPPGAAGPKPAGPAQEVIDVSARRVG